MKKFSKNHVAMIVAACCAAASSAFAENQWLYDPSPLYPFGAANPVQSDPEARIFDRFIGVHQCTQKRMNQATGKTAEAEGNWVWHYDMNGYGIRDEYRYNQGTPVSQRIYNPQTKQWHVWYFLGQTFYYAGEWIGGQNRDRIVLEQRKDGAEDQPVTSRLEFYDMTDDSFEWKSTNIDSETGDEFIDWEITCLRQH